MKLIEKYARGVAAARNVVGSDTYNEAVSCLELGFRAAREMCARELCAYSDERARHEDGDAHLIARRLEAVIRLIGEAEEGNPTPPERRKLSVAEIEKLAHEHIATAGGSQLRCYVAGYLARQNSE